MFLPFMFVFMFLPFMFVFMFFRTLSTQQGGYVHATNLYFTKCYNRAALYGMVLVYSGDTGLIGQQFGVAPNISCCFRESKLG